MPTIIPLIAAHRRRGRGGRLLCVSTVVLGAALSEAAAQLPPPPSDDAAQAAPNSPAEVQKIEGSLVTFEMVSVPGGSVQLPTPGGPRTVSVAPFWMGKTEVPWELYDVFVYRLDRPQGGGAGGTAASRGGASAAGAGTADALSRPSKPYVIPGEQFGHDGRPALAMTYEAAQAFARWLSAKTGRRYRLPTEAEWTLACRQGATKPGAPADLARRAWYFDNADDKTHPVASLAPNALGVHDLLGNVAEWVTGADGQPVVAGGSFDDDADAVGCLARRRQTAAWNATDPQLPKSRWWLADAPFVGFRLVREPADPSPASNTLNR